MKRQAKPRSNGSRSGSGNGHGHVDARRLIVPLWAAVVIATGMLASAATVTTLYLSLTYELRTLAVQVNRIADSVQTLKIEQAAERNGMVTRRDLELMCLQAQLHNSGWKCPLVTASLDRPTGGQPVAKQ